jgi:hypothetical protein
MGKRELLIAAGFIVVAALAYQLTAPAPKPGERGFSLSRIFDNFRRELRSDAAHADFTQTGTIKVGAETQELRLNTNRAVPVTVEGEDRQDIAYEMPVRSSGPDVPSALDYAKKSALEVDDLGGQITIGVFFPKEGNHTATLTLKVPSRLAVRIETAGRPKIRGVAAVHLGRNAGEVVVENIRDSVTGSHLGGDLTITKAGSVNLILVSSQAKIAQIDKGVTLNARGGECAITGTRGTVEITSSGARLSLAEPGGPVEITGDGGQIRVDRPASAVRIDIRRAKIEITLNAAVPLTVLTSDEQLRLVLDGTPAIDLDAIANNAEIQAAEFGLQPETTERAARLAHAFGNKGARVVLRNSRGNIVLARAK